MRLSRGFVFAIFFCIGALCCTVPAFSQTFQNPLIIPTSSTPSGLATADLNHDGKPDLVYVDGQARSEPVLHILLGDGNRKFSHGQDISLPANICCAITLADVTGDGNPDIILEGGQPFSFQVAVLIGNGDGTFQSPLFSTIASPSSPADPYFISAKVGDVNGDGAMDLVALDTANGDICVLFGDNTGKFTLGNSWLAYTRNSIYLTDLNGDGDLDIVATDDIGATFLVYFGNGDGTFQPLVRYTGQPSTGAFILADLDGDGHPDMLTLYYPDVLAYFPGNADGTFGALTTIGSVGMQNLPVNVGDLNSDGIADLLFTTPTGVGVTLGTGNMKFSPMQKTVSGNALATYPAAPPPLVTGDFDSDGHLDVAMRVEDGIAVLFGKGDGTFVSADNYDMGQEVGAATVADFNGDSFPDIAVTLPATFPRLLLGNGKGTFTLGPDPNAGYASSGADSTIVAADFNGDGTMDLNLGNMVPNQPTGSSQQSIALGHGDGTFSTPIPVANSSPIVADLNQDKRADMVYVYGSNIVASLGQADGTFVTVTTPLRLADFAGLFNVGDVNNDGKPDLVINYRDHLEVWLGDGNGGFDFLGSVDMQGVSSGEVAAVADLDGDGNADILLAPEQNVTAPLAILYGNGDGTFQSPVFVPISHGYWKVRVADLNGDNKPDLVMTDGATVAVLMNMGDRKFASEVDYVAGAAVSALSVKDVNGDGFPDIVAANTGGTTVAVLLNEPNGVSPAGYPVSGAVSVSPNASVMGQPFSISLTVSGQSGVPTGTVSFSLDGVFFATVPLDNGTATYAVDSSTSSTVISGQHTAVAIYNGNTNYAEQSFAALFTVQPPTYITQTVLTASPSTVLASQTVRLSAAVTSTVSVPQSMVTFMDGSRVLGSSMTNSSGVAYLDTAMLSGGAHSLTAEFDGYVLYSYQGSTRYIAGIFNPSTSAPVTVTVNTNATSTTLSASSSSLTAGTVVTFTATVNSPAGAPFGGVSFYDDATLLGTMALNSNSVATFSTASLDAGTHSIVAAFNSNGTFAGSDSSSTGVSVAASAAAFKTVVSLALATGAVDGSTTLIADVGSVNGSPQGKVTFLDSGAILGSAQTDPSGRASLKATLADGVHHLSASFGGGADFAPSVSPEFADDWPATGPGFSFTAGADTLRIAGSSPASLPLSVVPFGGFEQSVQLSCSNGLPKGYTCSLSPATLAGGGTSTLTISPRADTSGQTSAGEVPWFGMGLGFLLLGLLGSLRRRKLPALVLVCSAFFMLSSCNASFPAPRETVLTIRATTTNEAEAIVHFTQVIVSLP